MTSPSEEYSDEDLVRSRFRNVSIRKVLGGHEIWSNFGTSKAKFHGVGLTAESAWTEVANQIKISGDARYRIRLIRKLVFESKNGKRCKDCQKVFPYYAMDFDHVRGEKKFNVCQGYLHTLEEVKEELAKCEVVCACCHRIRSHKRTMHKKSSSSSFSSQGISSDSKYDTYPKNRQLGKLKGFRR